MDKIIGTNYRESKKEFFTETLHKAKGVYYVVATITNKKTGVTTTQTFNISKTVAKSFIWMVKYELITKSGKVLKTSSYKACRKAIPSIKGYKNLYIRTKPLYKDGKVLFEIKSNRIRFTKRIKNWLAA